MLNYTNIPIIVDGTTYLATQANFSVATALDPVYSLGKAGKVAQNPNGPIKGTLSFDYNINGDNILSLFNNVVSNVGSACSPSSVSIGGQSFTGAYLTSHGSNGQANQLATARAGFDLYFANTSEAIEFGNNGSASTSNGSIALGHGAASSVTGAGITDATSFSYDGTIQYDYIFKLGSINPMAAFVSRGSKRITLEGYSVSQNITMCGVNAIATANVNPICGNGGAVSYSVSGQITQLEGSVSAGQVGRGKATVTQFI